jgi:hypothetical protein
MMDMSLFGNTMHETVVFKGLLVGLMLRIMAQRLLLYSCRDYDVVHHDCHIMIIWLHWLL